MTQKSAGLTSASHSKYLLLLSRGGFKSMDKVGHKSDGWIHSPTLIPTIRTYSYMYTRYGFHLTGERAYP